MEILYKASNLEISYDPETRIMFCNWKGQQTKSLITHSGGIILQHFKEKQKDGYYRLLNDNTLKVGSWHDSVDFAINEWFPLMIDAGLQYFAWVFSKDFFTELSAKHILHRIRTVSVVRPFKTYGEAHAWLLQQGSS